MARHTQRKEMNFSNARQQSIHRIYKFVCVWFDDDDDKSFVVCAIFVPSKDEKENRNAPIDSICCPLLWWFCDSFRIVSQSFNTMNVWTRISVNLPMLWMLVRKHVTRRLSLYNICVAQKVLCPIFQRQNKHCVPTCAHNSLREMTKDGDDVGISNGTEKRGRRQRQFSTFHKSKTRQFFKWCVYTHFLFRPKLVVCFQHTFAILQLVRGGTRKVPFPLPSADSIYHSFICLFGVRWKVFFLFFRFFSWFFFLFAKKWFLATAMAFCLVYACLCVHRTPYSVHFSNL